jgi:hypothetical protein
MAENGMRKKTGNERRPWVVDGVLHAFMMLANDDEMLSSKLTFLSRQNA